jgi:hypothetical protein
MERSQSKAISKFASASCSLPALLLKVADAVYGLQIAAELRVL